jgi:hypothetical protein
MSPRRARPARSNWLGRRSNSFSAGGAEIFNAVIMVPQPLAIATATSAPKPLVIHRCCRGSVALIGVKFRLSETRRRCYPMP